MAEMRDMVHMILGPKVELRLAPRGICFHSRRFRGRYHDVHYLCFDLFLFGKCDRRHRRQAWYMHKPLICNEEVITGRRLRTDANFHFMWKIYIDSQTMSGNSFLPYVPVPGPHTDRVNISNMHRLFSLRTEWPLRLSSQPAEVHPLIPLSITFDNSIRGSTTMVDLNPDCLVSILKWVIKSQHPLDKLMKKNLCVWLRVCRKFNTAADSFVAQFVENYRTTTPISPSVRICDLFDAFPPMPTSLGRKKRRSMTDDPPDRFLYADRGGSTINTAHGCVDHEGLTYTFDRGIIRSIISKNFSIIREKRWSDNLVLKVGEGSCARTYILSEQDGFDDGIYDIPYDTVFPKERRIIKAHKRRITHISINKDNKVINKDFDKEVFVENMYHISTVGDKVRVRICKEFVKEVRITDDHYGGCVTLLYAHGYMQKSATYRFNASSCKVIYCKDIELDFDENSIR